LGEAVASGVGLIVEDRVANEQDARKCRGVLNEVPAMGFASDFSTLVDQQLDATKVFLEPFFPGLLLGSQSGDEGLVTRDQLGVSRRFLCGGFGAGGRFGGYGGAEEWQRGSVEAWKRGSVEAWMASQIEGFLTGMCAQLKISFTTWASSTPVRRVWRPRKR
jgi:hypothetical protein